MSDSPIKKANARSLPSAKGPAPASPSTNTADEEGPKETFTPANDTQLALQGEFSPRKEHSALLDTALKHMSYAEAPIDIPPFPGKKLAASLPGSEEHPAVSLLAGFGLSKKKEVPLPEKEKAAVRKVVVKVLAPLKTKFDALKKKCLGNQLCLDPYSVWLAYLRERKVPESNLLKGELRGDQLKTLLYGTGIDHVPTDAGPKTYVWLLRPPFNYLALDVEASAPDAIDLLPSLLAGGDYAGASFAPRPIKNGELAGDDYKWQPINQLVATMNGVFDAVGIANAYIVREGIPKGGKNVPPADMIEDVHDKRCALYLLAKEEVVPGIYDDIYVILFEKKSDDRWGLHTSGLIKSHITFDDVEQGYCVVSCRSDLLNRFKMPTDTSLHFCNGNGMWSVLTDELDVTDMPVLIMTVGSPEGITRDELFLPVLRDSLAFWYNRRSTKHEGTDMLTLAAIERHLENQNKLRSQSAIAEFFEFSWLSIEQAQYEAALKKATIKYQDSAAKKKEDEQQMELFRQLQEARGDDDFQEPKVKRSKLSGNVTARPQAKGGSKEVQKKADMKKEVASASSTGKILRLKTPSASLGDPEKRYEGAFDGNPPDWQPRSNELKVLHWIVSKPNPQDMEHFRNGTKKACHSWQKPCAYCPRGATKQCVCSREVWRCDKCMLWHVSSDIGKTTAIAIAKMLKEQETKAIVVDDDDAEEFSIVDADEDGDDDEDNDEDEEDEDDEEDDENEEEEKKIHASTSEVSSAEDSSSEADKKSVSEHEKDPYSDPE